MPKAKPNAALVSVIANAHAEATGKPLEPQQMDFLGCLIPALIAAIPAFLDSFISCIGGGSSSYSPDDTKRCG
jgi:hypothetical protein